MHAHLSEFITPFNNALGDARTSLDLKTRSSGRALMDQIITQQAAIIAYANDFKLLMVLTMLVVPLVFLIRTAKKAGDEEQDAVMD